MTTYEWQLASGPPYIDSSGYTFPYVATWAQDRAVLKRNLAAIQQTAHRIIAGIEGEEMVGVPDLRDA